MSLKSGYLLFAAGIALGMGAQDANAATRQVGTCTSRHPQYMSIQSAVSAANSGDVIQICPGVYQEQVVIPQNMTLENVTGMASPTVASPPAGLTANVTDLYATPTAAQIAVIPTLAPAKVNIKNLIVDGSGNNITTCAIDLVGIYYQNAGGTISGNTAQNQLLPPGYQGCQGGLAISVESETAGTPTATITGNTVTNFDKNGITVGSADSNATITNNIVTGVGATDVTAQNGIQVGYNATARVTGNQVSGFIYTGPYYGSSGILLYDMQAGSYLAPSRVSGNTVSSSQYGVVLDAVNGASGSLVQVKSNIISGSQFAGVGLYSDPPGGGSDDYIAVLSNTITNTQPWDDIDACSDNNHIGLNTISNGGTQSGTESGIHLDGECTEPDSSATGTGNTVYKNQIADACAGILSGPASGNNTIPGNNSFSDVGTNIVYGSDVCGTPNRQGGGTKGNAKVGPARHVQPVAFRKSNGAG